MNSEDWNGPPGNTEVVDEDNVVRLPREWLGPPENLVPMGGDPEPGEPGETLDFWGTTVLPPPTVAPRARRHAGRYRPGRLIARTRVDLSARRISGGGRSRSGDQQPRRIPGVAVLGVAAALILIALAISPGRPSTRRIVTQASIAASRTATQAPARSPVAASTLSPGRDLAALGGRRTSSSGRRVSARRRSAHRAPVRRQVRARSSVNRSPASAARAVTSSGSTPSSGASSSSGSTAAASPTSSGASSSGRSQSTSPGTSAGSSQPVTGAAGLLGPGTSHDG